MPYKDKEKAKQQQKIYGKKWYNENKESIIKRHIENQKRRSEAYQEFKKTLKCSQCEENHPACLDFHHLDPNEKDANIGKAHKDWTFEKLKTEMEKCIVLCANCHRKFHWEEKQD